MFSLRYLAPRVIFTGSKSAKFGINFRHHSHLSRPPFEMEQKSYLKSKITLAIEPTLAASSQIDTARFTRTPENRPEVCSP